MRPLIIAALALSALAAPAAAYSGGYIYRRSITVAGAVVPSTQVNFPMLVSGTYSFLATLPNQGMIHNTTTVNSQIVPADLIFTADAAGTTLLNWEVASYTAATGKLEVWVQVPSLSNGTVIYMFYDNAAVTAYQGNANSAWDTFSQATWHMANGVTQSLVDSTGNGNSLAAGNTTAASGQIDGASANNGQQTTGLTVTNPTPLYNLPSFTYSMWVNPAALTNTMGNGTITLLDVGYLQASLTASTGTVSITLPTSGSYRQATSASTLAVGVWQYIAFTYSASAAPKIYLNGAEVAYSSQGAGSGTDSSGCCGVGLGVFAPNVYIGSFNGSLDEVRIANTSRAAGWIATEYNNQSSPVTFYAVGAVTVMLSSGGASSAAIIM
jgi:Concanavalin A-like lectin/glucanases superfamily